jgi:steroid delta-isomerase-like uncharacterized protein
MPADDPKAVIRRWVEAWNAQDLDAAEELLAPEFVRHDANLPDVVGPQAERQHIADTLTAFPDLHFEIEQLIAEGDLVAARYLAHGMHRGEFLGILGTGRPVTIQAVESYRLAGGKLAEQWFRQPTSSSPLEGGSANRGRRHRDGWCSAMHTA